MSKNQINVGFNASENIKPPKNCACINGLKVSTNRTQRNIELTNNKAEYFSELAEEYREAAVRLRLAIEDRKEQAARGNSVAARELAILRQMLAEMRDLRQLTQGYYTRPRDGAYTTSDLRAPRIDTSKK